MRQLLSLLLLALLAAGGCKSKSRRRLEARLERLSFPEIVADPALEQPAVRLGRRLYETGSCTGCHGWNGEGSPVSCPSLTGTLAWGDTRDAIFTTVKYGVRVSNYDRESRSWVPQGFTRWQVMPAFEGLMTTSDLELVTFYTEALRAGRPTSRLSRGGVLFRKHCALCHGARGEGSAASGTPRIDRQPPQLRPGHASLLRWLARDANAATGGKFVAGIPLITMPGWGQTGLGMSDAELKALTLYLYSLRGTAPAAGAKH